MRLIKCDRGFLLVDLLIAILIITVALISIAGLFLQSNRAAKASSEHMTASNLAQRQFEQLKIIQQGATPILTTETNYPFEFTDWLSNDLERDAADSQTPFSVRTRAIRSTEQNATNLLEVTVIISWRNNQNVLINTPFTTFFPVVRPAI